MLVLLIVLLPVLLIIYLEVKNYRTKKYVNLIPGPPALPIIGNAHLMGKTPSVILGQLFNWWREFDMDNFRVLIGYYPNIVVANVRDLEYILTSTELLQKSDVYDMLHPWLGLGLLTSHGSKWHKHRKMITPSFHFKILQEFHDVMNSNSRRFVEKLRKIGQGDNILDFQEAAHYFTLDVICETAMGVSINAMDDHDSDVVKAFKDICYNINMRAYHPIKRKNALFKYTSDYPEFERTLKVLQGFTNDVIVKRIAVRDSGANDNNDANNEYSRHKQAFLDTLLTATIDGRPLNQEEIYEEVSTFMFEGHDTTTSGISFVIYIISGDPKVQRRVFEEQLAVMNGDLKRDATFQEISEMKYLDLVIKEAQRLFPSVPMIGRLTDKDYNINGKLVPKGTSLILFLMALGYNDKNFPDPYRFNPDRFDTDLNPQKRNPFEYIPFSAGPRNCIGQKFALLEIKTVVSKIVRSFEILPALDELSFTDGYVDHLLGASKEELLKRPVKEHKYVPILSAVLTLKSENGIHIRLRERKV